ncbi:phage tail sheath subtilisin-like domain-containing protein [Dictyobacter formicarum]|uniref:Tail protein n=1 Tax=Dictyobacter formicarum TaxID=2778368 RepID=A0ABQ3VR91_9CHLR|nr:phage tail sheath subtilisin-like domain-containing protein [Dictyobacter formicarum]GHO87631.1 tail protein [Dictyobacter formicarum]
MPEYLAPGVYLEETSFRSKSIEGVSTSTAGFVGPTRYGPIIGDPELLTSFADFERIYGGLGDLVFTDGTTVTRQTNYMAYAARAFFDEGGKRLYVSRIANFGQNGYATVTGADKIDVPANSTGYASTENALTHPTATQIISRFPGTAGNMRITFTLQVSPSILAKKSTGSGSTLTRIQDYDLVHVRKPGTTAGTWLNVGDTNGLYLAHWDAVSNDWMLIDTNGTATDLQTFLSNADPKVQIRLVTVTVDVARPNEQGFAPPSSFGSFSFDPRSASALTTTFTRLPSTRSQFLTTPFALEVTSNIAQTIASNLFGDGIISKLLNNTVSVTDLQISYTLASGSDDLLPTGATYAGNPDEQMRRDFVDDPLQRWKNGLLAFEGIEDISIVAAPGYSTLAQDEALAAHNALINHCEKMRYRIAILDTPPGLTVSGALDFRNQRSSNYAALYYPWVTIPTATGRLNLPPSGFIAGIYARNDTNRSVSKAPANEVVMSAIDFEQRLNQAQQEVLNPVGINCLRFFPGRGYLVWGARTISDDPEWKYVNVRRYFAYLEHSIDRGTQWVIFENNNQQLWSNVRRTIEDFLLNEWQAGNLMGTKPEEAYFVRCDLSTMTQNDLDNGRLVCLIGVAPVRPAEFVIFRIGQWTANPSA